MAEKNDIIEKIARNYFGIQDFEMKKDVTTSARLIKIALETAFEAGENEEPDGLKIARKIAMSHLNKV